MSAPVSKADLDDQRWLDERIDALRDGIEAARDIWLNWTAIRNVSRFAGGLSYGDFIKSRLGYALPLAEVIQIMPGASTREIAKVAGVTQPAVVKARHRLESGDNPVITSDDQPATVLGADGKQYPARVVRKVEAEVVEPVAPEPAPPAISIRVVIQACERDLSRLLDGYADHLSDERFTARFGVVFDAIQASLREE